MFKKIKKIRDKEHKEFIKCKHNWKFIKIKENGAILFFLIWVWGGENLIKYCNKCGTMVENIQI